LTEQAVKIGQTGDFDHLLRSKCGRNFFLTDFSVKKRGQIFILTDVSRSKCRSQYFDRSVKKKFRPQFFRRTKVGQNFGQNMKFRSKSIQISVKISVKIAELFCSEYFFKPTTKIRLSNKSSQN